MAQAKWETMTWRRIGEGQYNIAYRSSDGLHVLKIQRLKLDAANTIADRPERSVRLWNEINPDYPAFVVEKTRKGRGWICPYIEGVRASDQEISDGLIDIFNRTGRIVVDAPARSMNFVKTPSGKVICIDVGCAFHMEVREQVVYEGGLSRRRSIDSLNVWDYIRPNFPKFFHAAALCSPIATNTIKALLFIKYNRPDILDVSFLKQSNVLTIHRFAGAYDGRFSAKICLNLLDSRVSYDEPQIPLEVLSPELEHIQWSCIEELKKYVNSRGTLNAQGEFIPSWGSVFFRDVVLTMSKVDVVLELIRQLKCANTIDDMKRLISEAFEKPNALKSNFSSGLRTRLKNCLVLIDELEADSEDSFRLT